MSRRRRLPGALTSARVKFERGKLHTRTAKREMFRFFKSYEEPTFRVEPDGDTSGLGIGDEFACFLVVDEVSYPDLPDSFSARFGDAIHNYRAALDHVAWQLVRHGSDPNSKRPNLVQFPILTFESDFRAWQDRRLPGVAAKQVEFIHSRHGYKRGKATNEMLLAIADLSNEDKHRAIHSVVAVPAGIQHDVAFTHCRPIDFTGPETHPELKPGTVVGRYSGIITGPKPNMDMGITPSLYIVLDDGRPMMKVLNEVRIEVDTILYAPEIAAAM